jgi:hypothetical protein
MYEPSKHIHIHVAILVCDTPIKPVLEEYGDYFVMFRELLKQGFDDLDLSEEKFNDIRVEFSEHQMVGTNRFPYPENIDAVVITGSSELLCKKGSAIAKHKCFRARCLGR